MLRIGIDTGVETGFAVWDEEAGKLVEVRSLKLHQAFDRVRELRKERELIVTIEDARLRKWIPNSGSIRKEMSRRLGAGSIKRDAKAWEDFLEDEGIAYRAIPPQAKATKWSAEYFKAVTGWKGRTNEHSRDAAVLAMKGF